MVEVSVEAMDSLLKACHGSPSLQQFIESYLKMVQKLLETNDPHLEKLATDLFVRFSTIEEDTPSYHRQYDFFISKFSSMCHASRGNQTRIQRFNGLRGLRGVIWKSVADDLQASIWEKQHMDKIVPSILFNLRDDRDNFDDSGDMVSSNLYNTYIDDNTLNDDPNALALQCLRELMGKASFGSLRSVLEPVMRHCDDHRKWDPPPTFGINTFRAIIYSIQTQNAYFVIQELINHLEEMANASAPIRIGIATVLSSIVSIASTSIGPLVLGIFNSLLKRLRVSVEFQQSKQCPSVSEEKTFQETLINAMGDFANALPDYQKIEIMMFTTSNIPIISQEERKVKTSDEFLQKVLVKTLLKVATKYKTFYFATMFTDSFVKTLLQICLAPNPSVRLNAQQILHTLVDRHDNLKQLAHLNYVHDVEDLQLSIEKCSRQDQLFMHRQIHNIVSVLFRVVCLAEDENLRDHLDAVLCSMCLICVEVGHDETLIELFRLAFGMQALALDTEVCDFSIKKRAEIHNLVAKFLNLSAQLLAIPALCQHVQQVIKLRAQRGHSRLNILAAAIAAVDPLKASETDSVKSPGKAPIVHMESEDDFTSRALGLENDPALLFDLEDVSEALKASNKDVSKLFIPFKPISIPGASTSVTTAIGVDDIELEKVNSNSSAFREIGSSIVFTAEDDADNRKGKEDNIGDNMSLDSSSIEWTPPGSQIGSRRNTLFGQKLSLTMPTTVDCLRTEVSQPMDPMEEERKDQTKSREIVQMFREKPFDEVTELLSKDLDTVNLGKTVDQLCKRNSEWAKIQEHGSVGKQQNIFEINFPSIVR